MTDPYASFLAAKVCLASRRGFVAPAADLRL